MPKTGEKNYSNIIVDYSSEERTLFEKTYTLFCQNPKIQAKQVCSFYHIDYVKHGQTINNYLTKIRSNIIFGHIPSDPKNYPHCRKWVWNKVNFNKKRKFEALSNGWKQSKNRNRMLMFKDKLGSVQWFETGKVNVLPKGSSKLADAKTLLCRAFSWLDTMVLISICDGSYREENRHWVFDVGVELPKFRLDFFKKTHGLTIGSDGSHPGKLEVEETIPLYLQETNKTLNLFAENIKSHLKLVEVLTKEAEERAAAHSNNAVNSETNLWRKFLKVMTTPL